MFRRWLSASRRKIARTLGRLADSRISDHYALLRTRLQRLDESERGRRIAVVGAVSGDGATLTAVNLAISMAREHRHSALIIDADLRRPKAHQYLGIDAEPGLSNHLIGGTPAASLVVTTETPGLTALPAGPTVADRAPDLLSSPRMAAMLSELAADDPDRYLILRCAPVLEAPDALVLSSLVDGYLLVVRAHRTRRDDILRARDLLTDQRLLGLVLNDIRGKRRETLI